MTRYSYVSTRYISYKFNQLFLYLFKQSSPMMYRKANTFST